MGDINSLWNLLVIVVFMEFMSEPLFYCYRRSTEVSRSEVPSCFCFTVTTMRSDCCSSTQGYKILNKNLSWLPKIFKHFKSLPYWNESIVYTGVYKKKKRSSSWLANSVVSDLHCLLRSEYLSSFWYHLERCFNFIIFFCVEVLRPSQPNGVMSSAVSLPNHTFTGQA